MTFALFWLFCVFVLAVLRFSSGIVEAEANCLRRRAA
jgi:hypothetical protein